jgi:dTMP kinase
LESRKIAVLATREPGGTPVGQLIRNILLDGNHPPIDSLAELLLYAADRAQHVAEQIRPALKRAQVVLCDRFCDATVAYQGHGRGLDLKLIDQLNWIATAGLEPQLTILFDCPVEVGLNRSTARLKKENSREDRFEKEERKFHEQVRRGYLQLAKNHPARFRVIDATAAPEEIHLKVLEEVLKTIGGRAGNG